MYSVNKYCLSPKCHAGYSIALTAATVCTASACTKRLDETTSLANFTFLTTFVTF